jgi:hypothetical protein
VILPIPPMMKTTLTRIRPNNGTTPPEESAMRVLLFRWKT